MLIELKSTNPQIVSSVLTFCKENEIELTHEPPAEGAVQSIAVHGKPKEGKTTTAVNLAIRLHREGLRICVVDDALSASSRHLRTLAHSWDNPNAMFILGSEHELPCFTDMEPDILITTEPQPNLDATATATEEMIFRSELAALLNKYSKENDSNTPDFILARYLAEQLYVFDHAIQARDSWYKKSTKEEATQDPSE